MEHIWAGDPAQFTCTLRYITVLSIVTIVLGRREERDKLRELAAAVQCDLVLWE